MDQVLSATPKVTVLMSVYNGEKFLREAVDSILQQTFHDFEFLIIDDASTDSTANILQRYEDPRIILIRNPENLGLTKSLNKGLKRAMGDFIARMDADDVSLVQRLEKQVLFMDAHPDIGVCGTWMEMTGDSTNSVLSSATKHEEIITGFLFGNTIFHPTVIIRKETIFNLGEFYDEQYQQAQDMEYWVRLSNREVKFANISEVLLKYRLHDTNVGKIFVDNQGKNADSVMYMQVQKLGIVLTEEEKLSYTVLKKGIPANQESVEKVSQLITKILKANDTKKIYPAPVLSRELAQRWLRVCLHSSSIGLSAWRIYFNNAVSRHQKLNFLLKTYFYVKCLLRSN